MKPIWEKAQGKVAPDKFKYYVDYQKAHDQLKPKYTYFNFQEKRYTSTINMIIHKNHILVEESDFNWDNIMYVAKDDTGKIVKFNNINGVIPWCMLEPEAQAKIESWKAISSTPMWKVVYG